MQFIEDHEKSPRAWYGGAVGLIGFNGSLNTGLTLRTIRLKDGVAQVRTGATLLYDSDPQAEEERNPHQSLGLSRRYPPSAWLDPGKGYAPGSGWSE